MFTWILTSVLLMLNLCLWIGNICNGLLLGNASIARGLTCCKKVARHEASRKSWSTKFPLGGGGKPYLASGLLDTSCLGLGKYLFGVLQNVHVHFVSQRKAKLCTLYYMTGNWTRRLYHRVEEWGNSICTPVIQRQLTRQATTYADINNDVTGKPTVRKRLILALFWYCTVYVKWHFF